MIVLRTTRNLTAMRRGRDGKLEELTIPAGIRVEIARLEGHDVLVPASGDDWWIPSYVGRDVETDNV